MIHIEYRRYVFDKVLKTISIHRLQDVVHFKNVLDHVDIEPRLREAYTHAKEWINSHEGEVKVQVLFNGIDYSFKLNSIKRLFDNLIIDGHIPVIDSGEDTASA